MELGSVSNIIYFIVFILSLAGLVVLVVIKYRRLSFKEVEKKADKPLISLSLPKIKVPVAQKIKVRERLQKMGARSGRSKNKSVEAKPVFVNKSVEVKDTQDDENQPVAVKTSTSLEGSLSLSRAKIFLKLKNFLSAEDVALRLLEKDPSNGEIYAFLAKLYREQGNWKDSALCLDQALNLGKRDVNILLDRIEAWGKRQSLRKVKSSLKQALKEIKTNKDKARAYFLVATAFEEDFSNESKALQNYVTGFKLDAGQKDIKAKAKKLAQKLAKIGEQSEDIDYFFGKKSDK